MSSAAITRLRALFETELSTNPTLYHPIDIARVRTEDWQIKRFLLDQPSGDESLAFNALLAALRWKQSFGLHTRTDAYFPLEIWQLNVIEIYGTDTEGRLIQWEAIRNQRVWKETSLLAKQFMAHCTERIDRQAGEKGFILITDANGGGIANIDMDLTKFKIATMEHYPQAMKAMYIVDLPWLLNAIMKIVISLMGPKLSSVVKFVKSSELPAIMKTEYIPVGLKGPREKHAFPENLTPLDQSAHIALDDAFLDFWYKTFKLARTNK